MTTPTTRSAGPTARPAQGLDAIADAAGVFSILAMDQRNTLRRMFVAAGHTPSDDDLRQAKVDVARALTPAASGMLLDPTIGVPAVTGAGALAPTCGLLVAAEPEVRDTLGDEPRTRWEPSQDAAWVRAQGGAAVKFLVQLRADRRAAAGEPDLAAEALEAVRRCAVDARAAGVPSVVENLVYVLPGEELTPERRADAIIEAARALTEIDEIDALKLEHPGSAAACRRLAEVVTKPWAVLSAGVPFEEFTGALEVAYDEGGACGFIAGRSVWREAVGMFGPERAAFLDTVARPRLDALLEGAAGRARPWHEAAGRRSAGAVES